MSFFVDILCLRCIIEAMGSREHLSGLKDHFNAMLVAMHFCCEARIFTEDEYVHAPIIPWDAVETSTSYEISDSV